MKTGLTVVAAAISAIGGTGLLAGIHVPFLSTGYTPPAECVQWYNGCNMCTKQADGSVSCTNRICASRGKGFCGEYATSTADTASTTTN